MRPRGRNRSTSWLKITPTRLLWSDGRVETIVDGVDAEATKIQVQTAGGNYEFTDSGEIDEDGFKISVQVVR